MSTRLCICPLLVYYPGNQGYPKPNPYIVPNPYNPYYYRSNSNDTNATDDQVRSDEADENPGGPFNLTNARNGKILIYFSILKSIKSVVDIVGPIPLHFR